MAKAGSTEKVVREIRRHTRRRFSAEEKIRIVQEGLRGEESIAALCRREGLAPNLYYRWSKEFLEAGKKRLLGDTTREATVDAGVGRDRDARLGPGPGPSSSRCESSDSRDRNFRALRPACVGVGEFSRCQRASQRIFLWRDRWETTSQA